MNRPLALYLISIFAVFLGSQITEGCLLVPYWKSMPTTDFYEYYSKFGPSIAKFYSILTIIAALISIGTSIYCLSIKSRAFKYSALSTLFAILFIALFYLYFKDINQQFYNTAFDSTQLKAELTTWENWHWTRVVFEFLSLTFLIITYNILIKERDLKNR